MERPLIVYMIDNHDKVFSQIDQKTYTFNNFKNTYDPMILDIIHDKNVKLPMLSSIVLDKKDSPISIDSIATIMNEYIIANESSILPIIGLDALKIIYNIIGNLITTVIDTPNDGMHSHYNIMDAEDSPYRYFSMWTATGTIVDCTYKVELIIKKFNDVILHILVKVPTEKDYTRYMNYLQDIIKGLSVKMATCRSEQKRIDRILSSIKGKKRKKTTVNKIIQLKKYREEF